MSNSTKNKPKESEHICEENHCPHTRVLYKQINVEQWSWVLFESWPDDEPTDLDSVSKSFSTHTLLINFCPFCGFRLDNIKASVW